MKCNCMNRQALLIYTLLFIFLHFLAENEIPNPKFQILNTKQIPIFNRQLPDTKTYNIFNCLFQNYLVI